MRGKKGLTPEVAQRICSTLATCPNITIAFAREGLDRDCYYDWKAKGEAATDPENEYAKFLRDSEQAIAEFKVSAVARVYKAGLDEPKNWPAIMTLLERLDPENFGRRDRHELSGPQGGPIQHVDLRKLSDDQLERLREGENLTSVLGSGAGVEEEAEG